MSQRRDEKRGREPGGAKSPPPVGFLKLGSEGRVSERRPGSEGAAPPPPSLPPPPPHPSGGY